MKTLANLFIISLLMLILTVQTLAGQPQESLKKTQTAREIFKMKTFNPVARPEIRSQYLVKDQMIHYWSGASYDTSATYIYTYNGTIYYDQMLTRYYSGGQFTDFQLDLHFRNEAGLDTAVITQQWIDLAKEWVNISKSVYQFNQFGEMTSNITFQWDEFAQNWVILYGDKVTIGYDNQSRPVSRTYEYFEPGMGWELAYRELYSYTTGVVYTELIQQNWDPVLAIWENEYRETYELSNNEWSEAYLYYWDGFEWQYEMWVTDIIWHNFSNLQLTSYIMYEYFDGSWEPYLKVAAEYNTLDMPLLFLMQNWDGTNWINSERSVWTYDQNFNLSFFVNQTWDGVEWQTTYGGQWAYEYDANNNIAVEYFEVWDWWSRGWMKVHKLESWYELFTGLPKFNANSMIVNVYPNPVSDQVNITLAIENLAGGNYRLLDLSGRSVVSGVFPASGNEFSISLQNVKNGIYVLQIETGGFMSSHKILKI